MDISGMFEETGQNAAKGDSVSSSGSQSAAINVDGLIGADSSATNGGATTDNAATNMVDPLSFKDGIIPNETVTTNDLSVVGEAKPPEEEPEPTVEPFMPELEPKPAPEPEAVEPEPEPPIIAPTITEPTMTISEPDDPEKEDFIKTYTAEYDDTLRRATAAVDKTLDSVDKSIHEKLPDIIIPEEANEFLKKHPEGGKVEKFEEVREMVREIMEHANEAKQQSEAAAAEAARIYDEVQAFKKETKEQIAALTKD